MAERTPLVDRLLRRVVVEPDECWVWTGYRAENGYGVIAVTRTTRTYTHRADEGFVRGPIPAGLHIDHLCRNRACCNPAHLEAVTCLENVRRGHGNVAKTHCPQGHAYEGDNVLHLKGRRHCRTCNRLRARAWREARKAA